MNIKAAKFVRNAPEITWDKYLQKKKLYRLGFQFFFVLLKNDLGYKKPWYIGTEGERRSNIRKYQFMIKKLKYGSSFIRRMF